MTNRYHYDETFESECGDIFYLKKDNQPVTGIIYYVHTNGQLTYEGNFRNGKKHGLERLWYECGQIHRQCTYENGVEHGEYLSWHSNGQLATKYTSVYGEVEGKVLNYHENGQLHFEYFKIDGKQVGLSRSWHENGQLDTKAVYSKAGEIDGFVEWWWDNGQLQQKTFHSKNGLENNVTYSKNGDLVGSVSNGNGTWITIHDNGQIASAHAYKGGKRNGLGIEWHSDGNYEYGPFDDYDPFAPAHAYKERKRNGQGIAWHSDDNLRTKGYWKDDKEDGVHRFWDVNGLLSEKVYKLGKPIRLRTRGGIEQSKADE